MIQKIGERVFRYGGDFADHRIVRARGHYIYDSEGLVHSVTTDSYGEAEVVLLGHTVKKPEGNTTASVVRRTSHYASANAGAITGRLPVNVAYDSETPTDITLTSSAPSFVPVCGNGMLEPGEKCDGDHFLNLPL